jgi:uncharacterized membrane protein YgaE (UPF0421/DUF939 family)
MSFSRLNRKNSIIESFCFGLPFRVFLQQELNLNEERRVIALRLFIILIVICTLNATFHPPIDISLALAMVLLYSQTLFNNIRAIKSATSLAIQSSASILLGLYSIILWADQPWFFLPWGFLILFGLLCHARINRILNIPPLVFTLAAFLSPEYPVNSIEQTLWLVLTFCILPGGLIILAEWTLWPTTPFQLLRKRLGSSFSKIEAKIDSLLDNQKQRDTSGLGAYLRPGRVSVSLTLLRESEATDLNVEAKHLEWASLIFELDNWFNILSEIERVLSQGFPTVDLNAQDREDLLRFKQSAILFRNTFIDRPDEPSKSQPLETKDRTRPSLDVSPLTPFFERAYEGGQRMESVLKELNTATPNRSKAKPTKALKRPSIQPMTWLSTQFAKDHEDSLIWAFKVALSTTLALLLVQSLNWPGINTAMMTCILVADNSLGADYRKSMMRILGASIGGVFAYFYILVLMPATSTIAGFLVAISPFLWVSSWIAAGTPRVSYIGMQIGFAFALSALNSPGPIIDLVLARDRILGILIGIIISGALNFLLWPQRSETISSRRLTGLLRNLANTMRSNPAKELKEQVSETLINDLDTTLQESLNILEHAQMEPKAPSSAQQNQNIKLRYIIHSLQYISNIILARHRFFLSQRFGSLVTPLEAEMNQLREAYGVYYDNLADVLEKKASMVIPDLKESLTHLNEASVSLMKADTMEASDLSSLRAIIALENKLVNVMIELGQQMAVTETHNIEERLMSFGLLRS